MDKEFNYIVSSSETVRWFPSKISSKDRLVARPFSLPESIHNKMLYEKEPIVNIPFIIYFTNESLRFIFVNF